LEVGTPKSQAVVPIDRPRRHDAVGIWQLVQCRAVALYSRGRPKKLRPFCTKWAKASLTSRMSNRTAPFCSMALATARVKKPGPAMFRGCSGRVNCVVALRMRSAASGTKAPKNGSPARAPKNQLHMFFLLSRDHLKKVHAPSGTKSKKL